MPLSILPPIVLTKTEVDIVAEQLANPAVVKYLRCLATSSATDLVMSGPAINETAESFLRRQAVVKGRLEVLETLLSIKPQSV